MAAITRRQAQILRALGHDPQTVTVEWQGRRFTVRHLDLNPPKQIGGKKGLVFGFSDDARLNALKKLSSMNWAKARPGVFITLTYPDSVLEKQPDYHRDRAVFWKHVERSLGREVSAFWRVEWIDRKSGVFTGLHAPHHHMLVPRLQYLDHKRMRDFWRKTCEHKGKIVTEVRRVRSMEDVSAYTAKYLAKQDDCSLVLGAYHAKPPVGRHWGMLRRKGLPWAKETIEGTKPDWRIEHLEKVAAGIMHIETGLRGCGFTLLGDNAEKAGNWFFKESS